MRLNVFAVLGGFGSITYLIRNLGNAVTKKGNKFGLDNSMIKRLYSIDSKKITGHMVDVVEEGE